MRTFDERSERNLKTLLPQVEDRFRDFLADCLDRGYHIKLISGTRTFAEQDALFAQGRTASGPRVTNAQGGFSNHNFRIAGDVGLFTADGKYLEDSPQYAEVGAIGKKHGLLWGGDWKFKDEPHFEYPTGLTLAQLRQRAIDGVPILPEPPKPQGWSVVGPDGAQIGEELPVIGGKVYAPVRAIWEASGGIVDPDPTTRVIRLKRAG